MKKTFFHFKLLNGNNTCHILSVGSFGFIGFPNGGFMFWKLVLAFTLIPVVEIYLLIRVGSVFGALTTVLIVIGTGILGASLARTQGLKTMFKVREQLQQGIMPAGDLIDALLIVVAGVVLLTPGFLTDLAGFLLLIPATRIFFKQWLRRRFESLYVRHTVMPPPKNIN